MWIASIDSPFYFKVSVNFAIQNVVPAPSGIEQVIEHSLATVLPEMFYAQTVCRDVQPSRHSDNVLCDVLFEVKRLFKVNKQHILK